MQVVLNVQNYSIKRVAYEIDVLIAITQHSPGHHAHCYEVFTQRMPWLIKSLSDCKHRAVAAHQRPSTHCAQQCRQLLQRLLRLHRMDSVSGFSCVSGFSTEFLAQNSGVLSWKVVGVRRTWNGGSRDGLICRSSLVEPTMDTMNVGGFSLNRSSTNHLSSSGNVVGATRTYCTRYS